MEPWQIPPERLGTQQLFRVSYQGEEGKLSFRLTLYLLAADLFRMEASDGIGRRVFSLDVSQEQALLLDHRDREFCRVQNREVPLRLPLADLSLLAFPKLLLGVLPAEPASELARDERAISFRDRSGQLWSGELAAGRVAWWSVSAAGEAVAGWQRRERESVFTDRRRSQQVRWTELVAEKLERPLDPLRVPAGYAESSCESLGR